MLGLCLANDQGLGVSGASLGLLENVVNDERVTGIDRERVDVTKRYDVNRRNEDIIATERVNGVGATSMTYPEAIIDITLSTIFGQGICISTLSLRSATWAGFSLTEIKYILQYGKGGPPKAP